MMGAAGTDGRVPGLLRNRGDRAAVLAIAAVAFLAYANTLGHGFVFDDIQNIVRNRWIRSPRYLPEIFSTHVAGFDPEFATSYYRPLMHIFYMAVYALAGLRPAAFHLLNILLHALVSLLGFLVARTLVERFDLAPPHPPGLVRFAPVLAGLLFATHPVHSEAVAWLAGITDLSFSLFGMLCMLTYLRARQPLGFAAAAGWLLLACLCKETAVAIVLVLATIEAVTVATRRAAIRESAARMAPLAGAVAVYLTLRWVALLTLAPVQGPHRYEASVSILAAVKLFGQYLRTLIVPAPLNALHVFRPPASVLDPGVLLGFGICATLIAAAWLARGRPLWLAGLAWTAWPLLPVLYTPVLGEGVFAERYLYFPSFGFALLLACAWGALTARFPGAGRVVLVAPLVVLAAYGVATVRRNPVWRDHLTLWSDTVRKSPGSAVAHESLCFALYEAGRFQEAADACRRALALDPTRLDARLNLGNALSVLGDFPGAARELDEVVRLNPLSVQALTTRGLVYMATGQPDLGLESYRRALALDPNNAEARNVLGVALARLGRTDEAVRELREAVRLAPDHPEYRENLRVLTGPSIRAPGIAR